MPAPQSGHVRRPAPQSRELGDEELLGRDDEEGRHGRGHQIIRQPRPAPLSGHVRRPAPQPEGPRPRELNDEGLFARVYEGLEVYARDLWSLNSPRVVAGDPSGDLYNRMDWEMDELG